MAAITDSKSNVLLERHRKLVADNTAKPVDKSIEVDPQSTQTIDALLNEPVQKKLSIREYERYETAVYGEVREMRKIQDICIARALDKSTEPNDVLKAVESLDHAISYEIKGLIQLFNIRMNADLMPLPGTILSDAYDALDRLSYEYRNQNRELSEMLADAYDKLSNYHSDGERYLPAWVEFASDRAQNLRRS